MNEPVIVVHGGAGSIAAELRKAAEAGVAAAASAGQAALLGGASAEDAVVLAVRHLEDDPAFNAGRGACMNALGDFELDAGIMRSVDLASGAVAAVPDVADAILVAQAVMHDGRHRVLAGIGAAEFGRAVGVGTFGRERVWTAKAQSRFDGGPTAPHAIVGQADTVGAVAYDHAGHTASGCSTGGTLLKLPGRVGDSPLCGAGFYAAPELGAAGATGIGEAILTHVAAYSALSRLASAQTPSHAAWSVCQHVRGAGTATCGLIVVTPRGEVGLAHRSEDMSFAIARGTAPLVVGSRIAGGIWQG